MEIIYCDFDWSSLVAILIAGGIGLAKHLTTKNRQQESRIPSQDAFPEEEMTVAEYKKSIYSPVSDTFSRDIFLEEEEEDDERSDEAEIMPGDYYYNEPLPKKEISVPSESPIFQQSTEEEEGYDFDIRKAVISSEILKRPQF